MNLKILMSFQLFIQRLPSIHTVRYLFSKANLFLALFLESLRLNKCAFSFKNPALGPVSRKVMVTFWAWKAVLSSPCLYSRSSFNHFENDTMKSSDNEAKLTGLWVRSCANFQQVLILKFFLRPEKFPGLSRNWAQVRMRNQQ